jgi:hypothetical protein
MTATQRCTLGLVAIALTACAKPIPARVIQDKALIQGCKYTGLVSDTDYVDLARKAGEAGGTHALIVRVQPAHGPLGIEIGKESVAEVYRCPDTK